MAFRTILIIGAGASNALHEQFALGSGLLQQISDKVTDRTMPGAPYLSNHLDKLGFENATRSEFVKYLDEYKKASEYPSIDSFLDEVSSYPEFNLVKDKFIQIGKFAIMFHILGYEAEIKNPLSGGLKDDAWIHEVAKFIDEKQLLEEPFPAIADLKIITFNYDRAIEHFLYNHDRFKDRKKEIEKFISTSIVHVYGKVGDLEWQNQNKFFEFGEDNAKADKIFGQKNSIDIMYLERMQKNLEENAKASKWIHSKDTGFVGSFGFNFDLINYRLLSLQNLGIGNDCKLIANIYPNSGNDFSSRRAMANRVRTIKHDAELTYLSCTNFLKEVFGRKTNP